MKYSVVIPNYNGSENLQTNIPKLLSVIDEEDLQLIVVDDSSTDDSVETMKKIIENNLDRKIQLIQAKKNKGFSSTVNEGVARCSGEIVILLNSDAFPRNNFLNFLEQDFSDEEVFAVGFLDESIEEGKKVLRGRGVGDFKNGFLVHSAGDLGNQSTLWASGGSSAFRKALWDKLGGLNDLYNPFYWEDIDISYRALKSGYKIIFDSKIVVVHEHEKGIIRRKFSSSKIKTIAYRNQFIFTWLNADTDKLFLNIGWLPYNMIRSLLRLDLEFWAGFGSFLIKLPKITLDRIKVQRHFIRKDSQVLIKK